LLWQ